MKRKYESIENEPALNGRFGKIDPSENRAVTAYGIPSELEQLRDLVTREPAIEELQSNHEWVTWYDYRSRKCSWMGNLAVTLLAGLIGGLFAVISAVFFVEKHGLFAMTYVVIGAPVVEELLKQSGMIYLLEIETVSHPFGLPDIHRGDHRGTGLRNARKPDLFHFVHGKRTAWN